MTLIGQSLDDLEPAPDEIRAGLPSAHHHFAPRNTDEAVAVMGAATDAGAGVLFVGGGTHQRLGRSVEADVVVSTARLRRIVAWEPDDLTVVVEGGMPVAELEDRLAEKAQTAALPERPGNATVGGVVATGRSGYRRARLGPTRDRLLEVRLVTGDGRLVTGGARVVKNVSGYDVPRLACGSLGTLGLIETVCLKLWPVPERSATLVVEDAARALRTLYRPLAVLETDLGSWAYVQGTAEEVAHQASAVGAGVREGLDWPSLPHRRFRWSIRVPPADVGSAIRRVGAGRSFLAQHGVGIVSVAADELDVDEFDAQRAWAESRGGVVVLEDHPDPDPPVHPFGAEPAAFDLQREIMATFDPAGIANRGRMFGVFA